MKGPAVKTIKVGGAIGLAVSAIVGVAAGILMVPGPANAPTPHSTPAGLVQQLDTTTTDVSTTTDAPVVSTTDSTPVVPPPATTTQDAPVVTTTTTVPPAPGSTIDPGSNDNGVARSPIVAPTTTTAVLNCVPDGEGITHCN
jgi:hypothetical protein